MSGWKTQFFTEVRQNNRSLQWGRGGIGQWFQFLDDFHLAIKTKTMLSNKAFKYEFRQGLGSGNDPPQRFNSFLADKGIRVMPRRQQCDPANHLFCKDKRRRAHRRLQPGRISIKKEDHFLNRTMQQTQLLSRQSCAKGSNDITDTTFYQRNEVKIAFDNNGLAQTTDRVCLLEQSQQRPGFC